jgi:WD40 repeat protein
MGEKRTFVGHTNSVMCVAVLPDGNFVSGANDRTLRMWNTNTGKTIRIFQNTYLFVNSVAVLPDGNFVSGPYFKVVRLWNTNTGEIIRTFEGHTDAVNNIAVLPDGNFISSSNDDTFRI